MNQGTTLEEKSISEVIKMANSGDVAKLIVQGNDVRVIKKGQDKPSIQATKQDGLLEDQGLEKNKTEVKVEPVSESGVVMWTILGHSHTASTIDCRTIYVHDASSSRPEQPSHGLWQEQG